MKQPWCFRFLICYNCDTIIKFTKVNYVKTMFLWHFFKSPLYKVLGNANNIQHNYNLAQGKIDLQSTKDDKYHN